MTSSSVRSQYTSVNFAVPWSLNVEVDDGLLRLWGYLAQVVQEACEKFCSQNTVVIFDDDLPSFLDSNICSWLLHCPQDHSLIMEGSNFRVKCYLTKLQDQGDFINHQEHGAGLRYLVTCPRLQSVIVDTHRGCWQMLDEGSKSAIEELARRLGSGFKVHMKGSG